MKSNSILTYCIIFLLISCKKNTGETFPFNGTVSATFNGQPWTPKIMAFSSTTVSNTFDLWIMVHSGGYERESFYVSSIPKTVEKHQYFELSNANVLAKKVMGGYTIVEGEGDEICDRYYPKVTDSLYNYVNIKEIKSDGTVSGSFSAKLFVRIPKCNISALDSILITDGLFETKIQN